MIITLRSKTVVESKKLPKHITYTNTLGKTTDYEVINVLPWNKKDSKYYELSPYYLKVDDKSDFWPDGILFENAWQSTKCYPIVYDTKCKPNYMSDIIWWEYKTETGKEHHLINDIVQDDYFKWRDSIYECKNPIRYPNSFKYKHTAKFALTHENNEENRRDYITARKEIYGMEYIRLIREIDIYYTILNKLKNGINICITEVDLPSNDKSGLFADVDEDGIFEVTEEKLQELVNCSTHSFGHGLFLCFALLSDLV